MSNRLKILFDFDGTVTKEETIPYVAMRLGLRQYELIAEMTSASSGSEVDYEKNLRKRIEMLREITIEDFVSNVPKSLLRAEVVSFIRENADVCEIVSCNLDCWCRAIASDLGVACHFSKAIVEDRHVIAIDYVMDKRTVVADYKRLGYDVAFVGDSVNDFAAMDEADLAVLLDNGYIDKVNVNPRYHLAVSGKEVVEVLNNYIIEFSED
ncbi:MAG: HAD-IB family phosphatase [Muribaculaceae bacterium]|nr:HAD-IB family phosphatase [Muribaculaceae bacterium]